MNTELILGPIVLTHQVQSIDIQESKGISVVESLRSAASLAIDSGDVVFKGQISLIISGIDELNTTLKKLVMLFKSCPITTIVNEQFYSITSIKYNTVTLDSLSLRTTPDLVDSVYLDIGVTVVDSGIEGKLLYKGQYFPSEDPRDCKFLSDWLDQLIGFTSSISSDDFSQVSFNIQDLDLILNELNLSEDELSAEELYNITFNRIDSITKVRGLSCTIFNYFGYNKLIGKSLAFPQHMGASSRRLSLELIFDMSSEEGKNEYKLFNLIKNKAAALSKHPDRDLRVVGWSVDNPIIKLFSRQPTLSNSLTYNIFVPLSISNNLVQEAPGLRLVAIDFAETNSNYIELNDVTLTKGGTDIGNLKKLYDIILDREYIYREKISSETSRNNFLDKIISLDSDSIDIVNGFRTFWATSEAIAPNPKDIKGLDIFGLLNKDTIRAVLFNDKVDVSGDLYSILTELIEATGTVRLPHTPINIYTATAVQLRFWYETVLGIADQVTGFGKVLLNVKSSLQNSLIGVTDEILNVLAAKLVNGLLGDYEYGLDLSSETGEVIKYLAQSNFKFTNSFKDALFDVIIERPAVPPLLDHVYSPEGISKAYYKLLLEYGQAQLTLGDNSFPGVGRDPIAVDQGKLYKKSTYPDLILPTYMQAFGVNWRDHAPTFDDLGLKAVVDERQIPNDISTIDFRELQKTPAVEADDIISPAGWFFNTYINKDFSMNRKDLIHSLIKGSSKVASDVVNKYVISVPFDVDDLESILKASEDSKTQYKTNIYKNQLSTLIDKAFKEHLTTSPQEFKASMDTLRAMEEDAKTGEKQTIYIYVSSKGNSHVKRRISWSGLGGEMYRVAKDKKYLNITDRYPTLSTDEEHKSSSRDDEFSFVRHTEDNTEKCLKSAIDNLDNLKTSYARLFPAIKVYLVDFRGDDIFLDDSFFDVNQVISVDVTLDKDDADLAIIKIADPLYLLQSSALPESNLTAYSYSNVDPILGVVKSTDRKVVQGNLRGFENVGGYLKRFKIAQGRGVMIKMGYDSCAKNLKTVFTGRISEIMPGDVLTIVCQGWKAELLNRQVSFYNEDPNSWGARDLAIQAIVKADPFGFGEHINQRDSNFILRNIGKLDFQLSLNRAAENTKTSIVDEYGNYTILDSIENAFKSYIGLGADLKKDQGIDTRLKNIWYPDAPDYSNIFGLRSAIGVMPSWLNDSWVVPLKPAWEVLKEAERHAWNCVVQVVPYDGRATIFMGHPDQPYYFSNGDPAVVNKWRKYSKKIADNNKSVVQDLVSGFKDSKFYRSSYVHIIRAISMSIGLDDITQEKYAESSIFNFKLASDLSTLNIKGELFINGLPRSSNVNFSLDYVSLAQALVDPNIGPKIVSDFSKSNIPLIDYQKLRRDYLGENTAAMLASLYFNIPLNKVATVWFNISKDIEDLLSPESKNDIYNDSVKTKNNIDWINGSDVLSAIDGLEDKIKLDQNQVSTSLYIYQPVVRSPLLKERVISGSEDVLFKFNDFINNSDNKADITVEVRSFLETIEKAKTTAGTFDRSAYDIPDNLRKLVKSISLKVGSALYTNLNDNESLSDKIINGRNGFKAFTHFFTMYIEQAADKSVVDKIVGKNLPSLPPNMEVFRKHYWIDSESDIINNSIVATTKEMWNTVIIEHPAKGNVDDFVESHGDVFTTEQLSAGVSWEYYPKQEVTQVLGLQFHPSLSLINKKIQVFTELNVYNPELAAKLAITRLAEGMRKMYRGNLITKGFVVKPHDRVVLKDAYTGMNGVLGVESVIHSWNLNNGWTTTILPELVADANPGASILHTASLEALYNIAFNTVDFIASAITTAIGVAALSGATSLRPGKFSVKQAAGNILNTVRKGGIFGGSIDVILNAIQKDANLLLKLPKTLLKGPKNPMAILEKFISRFGGPLISAFKTEVYSGTINQGLHLLFKAHVVQGFLSSSAELDSLPVIISPLLFQGRPLLAGLETDAPLWNIWAVDKFYQARTIQLGVEKFISAVNDYFGTDSSFIGDK